MKKIVKFGIVCGILFTSIILSCKKNDDYVMFSMLSFGKNGLIIDGLYSNKNYYIKYYNDDNIYKINLNDSIINDLISLRKKINFINLKKTYTSDRQDMNIFNVLISQNGKLYKIYYYKDEAPKPLESLINYLLSLRTLQNTVVRKKINFKTRDTIPVIKLPPPPIP